MGLRPGQKNLTVTLPADLHYRIHEIAAGHGISASRMVASWIEAGSPEPLVAEDEVCAVRSNGRELFVGLPREFVKSSGVQKSDRIHRSYSRNRLILTAK